MTDKIAIKEKLDLAISQMRDMECFLEFNCSDQKNVRDDLNEIITDLEQVSADLGGESEKRNP